jgi:asparagine synthase (glutamine-hydrolysing)
MCGIAGQIKRNDIQYSNFDLQITERMCDAMNSRGPDSFGYWSSCNTLIQFGHRRLSILDLDPRSNQPFVSNCHNYILVFNGEIYNFKELRILLKNKNILFITESDSEVLLNMYIYYGAEMLNMLRGMFAFSIWDNLKKTCFLARDPYGIKPLYVAKTKEGWLFASQVKALHASGLVSKEIDPISEASYWMLGSVAGPRTWFKDISEIPPGNWAEITEDGKYTGPKSYWNIGDSWSVIPENLKQIEVRQRVQHELLESVKYHLVSDVPVGIFLSGGIDSGALAGLMIESGSSNLIGITIAYEEFIGTHDDEVPIARKIADHYGIKHVVRKVSKNEFQSDLPYILADMDQPTVDGINTWYASKAAAEIGLKVVVSGIGGDELFLGYESFRKIPPLVKVARALGQIPGGMFVGKMLANMQAKKTSNLRWKHAMEWMQTIKGGWWLQRSSCSPEELRSIMNNKILSLISSDLLPEQWLEDMVGKTSKHPMMELAQIESMTYLRNQLLRDSDWASMAHSIELRTPLVDAHLLKNLAPLIGKFNKFKNKSLLALSPKNPLPQEIYMRRKTGFSIPVKKWIQEIDYKEKNQRMNWAKTVFKSYTMQNQ